MTETDNAEPDPTDGRMVGDWRTRYPRGVWVQIILELAYLLLLLVISLIGLFLIGCAISEQNASKTQPMIFRQTFNRDMLIWLAIALSGTVGGVVFDLKWLYHSVATNIWNQDRVLWRILVPIVGGTVSLFLAFIVFSNVLYLIRGESLKSIFFGMGFGFIFGYFSDNALAGLKKLADDLFGRTSPTDTY
jgi:hypothetical protein